MKDRKPTSWLVTTCATAAFTLFLAGCFVSARPTGYYGYDVEYDDSVPADIYSYPAAPYGDGYAYWYGDRWYYRGPGGWAYFRNEPAALYSHRSSAAWGYSRGGYAGTAVAPPAYGGARGGYAPGAPPARGGYAPGAPPARGGYAPPASTTTTRPRPVAPHPGTAPPAR